MVIIVKKFPLERCREEYDMDYIIFIIIIAILVEKEGIGGFENDW